MDEPNLFSLLFMQKRDGFKMVDFIITEGHYERIIQAAQTDFSLERGEAERLYHNLFTYAHGIAAMSATGVCSFSLEEVAQMLGMTCRSLLIGMKMPRDEREKTMPQMGIPMQGSVASYMMADRKTSDQDWLPGEGINERESMDILPGVPAQDKDTNSERNGYEKFPSILP